MACLFNSAVWAILAICFSCAPQGAGACGQLGHPDTSSFPSDEDGYPFQPALRRQELEPPSQLAFRRIHDAVHCHETKTKLALGSTGVHTPLRMST